MELDEEGETATLLSGGASTDFHSTGTSPSDDCNKIQKKVTLTGATPFSILNPDGGYGNELYLKSDATDIPQEADPLTTYVSVDDNNDTTPAVKPEPKNLVESSSEGPNSSTEEQSTKVSPSSNEGYQTTGPSVLSPRKSTTITIPLRRRVPAPISVETRPRVNFVADNGDFKTASNVRMSTESSDSIQVPLNTYKLSSFNKPAVQESRKPIRFTVSQPVRISQNHPVATATSSSSAIRSNGDSQPVRITTTPQRTIPSTGTLRKAVSTSGQPLHSGLSNIKMTTDPASAPVVLKRSESMPATQIPGPPTPLLPQSSEILLSDTKMSNFGTCSYLSPFSNDASVMIIGDNENEMYNIKPRAKNISVSPQLEIQPPTPHLSRDNSREDMMNDSPDGTDGKSRNLKNRQDTQTGFRGMINAFANASLEFAFNQIIKDPSTPSQDGGDSSPSSSSPSKPRFRIPAVITVVRKDGTVSKSDSFTRKVSLDPSKVKRREIDVSVRPRSVSVVSESVSKGSNDDETKREPHKILKDFLSSVLSKKEKQRSRQSVISVKYMQGDDAESSEGGGKSSKLLRYEFEKDQVYLGEVLDNKAHGHGVFHFKGCQYGGNWEHGMETVGCYLWPSGVQYYGLWDKGYRHGNGVEKHQNHVYKGEWVKGAKQGYGVASSVSGCKYEGTWYNNLHDGYGLEVYKDGGFYSGQFNHGIRDGHGIRIFNPTQQQQDAFIHLKESTADTTTEVPSEMDLERHISTEMFEANNFDKTEIYRGHWKSDKRHGPGIHRNAQGDVYEGLFKDNMRHGYGILHAATGQVIYGKWRKNELIKNTRSFNSSSQKAATAAKENCVTAERKSRLALSRALGARRFAQWAVLSQREAYKHFALAEEKEKEAQAMVDVGNVGISIIQNGTSDSPRAKSKYSFSKITEILTPQPPRKSPSSIEEESPLTDNRKTSVGRFLSPSFFNNKERKSSEDSLKSIPQNP